MSIGSLVSSGPLLLAVPVAAAAGAVTFLSPCCLPLVPGYLSYVTGMSGMGAQLADPQQAGRPARQCPAGRRPDGRGAARRRRTGQCRRAARGGPGRAAA